MEIKLKKAGNSTPPPTWKYMNSFVINQNYNIITTKANTCVSARKLGACLWENLPRHSTPPEKKKMSHHGLRQKKGKNKGFKVSALIDAALDDSPYELERPRPSDSSLKREIAASVIQNHRTVERNSRALQNVSPASYNSSVEVTPINPRLDPVSFLGLKGKFGNSRFNLKTSKELVVVLDRIWMLEEQHASNVSLVNSMKRELDQSRLQIKRLKREKNKEQERVKAIIKSMRDELENERTLRKQSENFHKKLAIERNERERNTRSLLEDLCDEFARGIIDFEQEVRHFKQRPDKDRLIVHLSEAWLDDRMQNTNDIAKGDSGIADKLSLEIETFLRTKDDKHFVNANKLSLKKPIRISLPYNLNEDESISGDSNRIQRRLKEKGKSNTKKGVSLNTKQGKFEGVLDPRVNSSRVLKKLVNDDILSLEEETLREDNEVSKATSKRSYGLKESTLKEKLREARLEG